MNTHNQFRIRFSPLVPALLCLLFTGLAQAGYIGGQTRRCKTCELGGGPPNYAHTHSAISLSEGNLQDEYHGPTLRSAAGDTIDFILTYNSNSADGSLVQLDTGMGYGWTHSYNIFLFQQLGSMFRCDGDGRITKYKLGAGGSFTAAPGYFETLVRNPDGSFTLTQKDKTTFTFAAISGTPFLVAGPVFRLIRIVDRNGNTTTLTYTAGNLTSITDTYGRSLVLGYNAQNRLVSVTDPLGRMTAFTYDSTGRKLIRLTDPLGKQIQYSYNILYQITGKVDRDGRTFSYLYANNRPVGSKDGAGATVVSLANPNNWATDSLALARDQLRVYLPSTTTKTDGRGNLWKYDYDSRGYLTKITAPPPENATTTYTYDPATLMVKSMTDANGHTTQYEYDAMGNRTKVTDAATPGNVTTMTYEPVFNMMTSMTDPNGRITTYEYDARGNRVREIDTLLQPKEWTYDAHGNVLTEKDKRGNITRYEYDASGNRIKITAPAPLSYVTTMTYDAVGNMLSRTDANAHTTSFSYDGLNRRITETDPLGKVAQTFYDGHGDIIQRIDRNSNSTSYTYDLRERLVKTTDALSKDETYTYDGNNNRTSMTDRNGHATQFQYDVQNRLTQTTDPIGCISLMTYDPVGNLLSETDKNGNPTTYTYDALNRRTLKTDAVLCPTKYDYDLPGMAGCTVCGPTVGRSLVNKITDGNGKVTYFKYDPLYRLIAQIRKEGDTADVVDPSDAVTQYAYDPNDNVLVVTEPNGNAVTSFYDALNRRTQSTNAAGDVTLWNYDGVGNVVTTTAPNGNVVTNTYDAKDRLTQVQDLIGLVARYSYDNETFRLSATDGNGNTTAFTPDALYRLIKTTDPLSFVTVHQYDPVGNLLATTDREGHTTSYTYDDVNRRITTTDALPATTTFTYDCVGNLKTITDCNSHTTSYTYDAVNRLLTETYPDPLPNSRTYIYDCVGNVLTRTDQKAQTTTYVYNDLYFLLTRDYPTDADDNFTYDLSGRMLTAEKGGWVVTFTYDGANRVTQTSQDGKIISYVYDIPGRKRTLIYPGGRVITEFTDARGRLSAVNNGSGPAFPPPAIAAYSYDLGNRVLTRTSGNGVVATYTYNANNWVTSLQHQLGATLIAGFGCDFDREGNKKFERNLGQTLASQAYGYDAIYRVLDFNVGQLAGATIPAPVTQSIWNLDCVGNWLTKTTDGVPETRTHNAANEITSIQTGANPVVPISHDDNGNLVNDGKYVYSYDQENRLIAAVEAPQPPVLPSLVGEYRYDALGRRVRKTAVHLGVGTETRYFHDGARVIEEQDGAMVTVATYTYGNYVDEVLSYNQTVSSGVRVYCPHANHLYSVAALTDAAANVVERYTYDAYGKQTIKTAGGATLDKSALGYDRAFTGYITDTETGLDFARTRQYSPTLGRFVGRDMIVCRRIRYRPIAGDGYQDGPSLYSAYFIPNYTDAYGTDSNPELTISNKSMSIGTCGSYSWIVSITLSNVKKNGWIVQSIGAKQSATDCSGNPIERCSYIQVYWEAWPVTEGNVGGVIPSINTRFVDVPEGSGLHVGNTDTFAYKGCGICSKGEGRVGGVMAFYPELSLTSQFQSGNPDTSAKALPSTTEDPYLPGLGVNTPLPKAHSVSYEWDCCSGINKTKITNHYP